MEKFHPEITPFNFAILLQAKNECTPQLLLRAASIAIRNSEESGCTVYYTDGIGDPETKILEAAAHSEDFSAC